MGEIKNFFKYCRFGYKEIQGSGISPSLLEDPKGFQTNNFFKNLNTYQLFQ